MSDSSNRDSAGAVSDQGESRSKAPGVTHPHHDGLHHGHHPHEGAPKHQPSIDSENVSHLKQFAPGTAPADRSFVANPRPEDLGFDDPTRDPLDFTGSAHEYDSKDADRGGGKPISGQSSEERHHDGQTHRKREHNGLVGLKEGFANVPERRER